MTTSQGDHVIRNSSDHDPMSKSESRKAAIVLIVFALAVMSRSLVFSWHPYKELYQSLPEVLQWLEQPVRWFLICWLGLLLVHRSSLADALRRLGLAGSASRAMLFCFIACSPMLIGPLIVGSVSSEWSLLSLLFYAGIWPLAEEILYRGYAFKQFYEGAHLGFWPSALITGLVFGLVHLGQASVQSLSLSGEIGTVAIISIGGIVYAWLFKRWEFNLWVPFGMHMFMNLWWNLFDLSDTPLGDWGANVLRLLTIVLAVILTIKRQSIPIFAKRA
jgi:membrane protease YdiL (CAAX protease family)